MKYKVVFNDDEKTTIHICSDDYEVIQNRYVFYDYATVTDKKEYNCIRFDRFNIPMENVFYVEIRK